MNALIVAAMTERGVSQPLHMRDPTISHDDRGKTSSRSATILAPSPAGPRWQHKLTLLQPLRIITLLCSDMMLAQRLSHENPARMRPLACHGGVPLVSLSSTLDMYLWSC